MQGAQSPLGTIGLAATTYYVADLDAAVAWYADKLGLQPMSVGKDAEPYASFLLGGGIVVLEPITAALDAAAPGSESTTINLVVDADPDEVREELLRRGVECGAVVKSPNFASFLMRDLDGNRYYVTRPATAKAQQDVTATAGLTPSGG